MTPPTIDGITVQRYRLPLDPPFYAAWDREPRRALESTVVRVRAGEHEGVGSGTSMAGFAGYGERYQRERHRCVRCGRERES